MTMAPRLRKFALTAHVVSSVGWLDAVAVFPARRLERAFSAPRVRTPVVKDAPPRRQGVC